MALHQAISFDDPPLQVPGAVRVQVSCRIYTGGLATISGGINAQLSFDGVTWGDSVAMSSGSILYARGDAPDTYSSSAIATVSIGPQSGSFAVRTCKRPAFMFTDMFNLPPGGTGTTRTQSTGCDLGGEITFVTSGQIEAPVVSVPNPVDPFGMFTVHYVSPPSWGKTGAIAIELNGFTAMWRGSTPAAPPTFVWASAQTIARAHGSAPQINKIQINNLVCQATISASGTGKPQISRDGMNWVPSAILTAADNGKSIFISVATPAIARTSNTGTFNLVVGVVNVALGDFKITAT